MCLLQYRVGNSLAVLLKVEEVFGCACECTELEVVLPFCQRCKECSECEKSNDGIYRRYRRHFRRLVYTNILSISPFCRLSTVLTVFFLKVLFFVSWILLNGDSGFFLFLRPDIQCNVSWNMVSWICYQRKGWCHKIYIFQEKGIFQFLRLNTHFFWFRNVVSWL